LLEAHRFSRVGLGTRTLRLDTACVALVSQVNASLAAQDF
jgi:16S rRNA U1498 N3-methylase RsmE